MSVNNISHLPTELLTPICSHLSRPDQRTLRLVSHRLNTVAQAALFQTIFLKLHLRSFEHLQAICQHGGLRKHVRTLCFDPRQLREPAWSVGFDYWCDHIVGSGLRGEEARSAARGAEPETLHGYFLAYRDFMEGFKALVGRRAWAGLLYSCVQNLPALSQIYYSEGQSQSALRLLRDLDDGLGKMQPDARLVGEICAVPDLPSSYDTGFWTVLSVISGTQAAGRITKISGLDIDSSAWARRTGGLKEIVRRFPNLRDLALTFGNSHNTYLEDYVHVPGILATATELRSLTVRNRYGRDPENPRLGRRLLGLGDVMLSSRYSQAQLQSQYQWPHLQRLDLYGLAITERDLFSVVAAHAFTLRYLRLSHVEFQLSSFPHKYARHIWVQMLAALVGQSPGLECVIFDAVTIKNMVVVVVEGGGDDESVAEEEEKEVEWYAGGVKADVKHRYPWREGLTRVWKEKKVKRGTDAGGHGEQEDEGVLRGWMFSDRGGAH